MFNFLSHLGNANGNIMRYHFILIQRAETPKTGSTMLVRKRAQELELPHITGGEGK